MFNHTNFLFIVFVRFPRATPRLLPCMHKKIQSDKMARNQNKAEWRLKRSLEEKHRQTHSKVYFFNKTSFFTPINRPRFLNCVLAFQLSCTYTRCSETFLHPIRNNIMWKGVDESSSIFSLEFVPMPIMQLNWDLFLDFMPSSEDYDFISPVDACAQPRFLFLLLQFETSKKRHVH